MPLTMTELALVFITVVGGVGLQIWLSTRKQWWLGLLLPLVSFAYSLYMVSRASFFPELNTFFKLGLYFQQNMLTIGLLVIYGICQWRIYKKTQPIFQLTYHQIKNPSLLFITKDFFLTF